MRPDGVPVHPHRQHALVHARGSDPARAPLRGARCPMDHEHHRRRSHDRRGDATPAGTRWSSPSPTRASPPPRSRRSTREAFLEDADLVGIERADLYPRATDHIPEMISMIETLIEKGHAYEVDGTVYYDVTTFPGYGKLSGQHARSAPRRAPAGARRRSRQAPPGGLRAVEERGREPSPEVAEPVGRRVSRVAHRVLRDVDQAPRRSLRRAHRGQRQQVPPPRGRDRAVRGSGRASRGVDLGARRVPADGRTEDGEVREEHQAGDRPRRAGPRPAGVPLVHVPGAIPVGDGFHRGRAPDGGPAGETAPPSRRGVGPGRGRPRAGGEGVRLPLPRGRWRTTSTCRPPSAS